MDLFDQGIVSEVLREFLQNQGQPRVLTLQLGNSLPQGHQYELRNGFDQRIKIVLIVLEVILLRDGFYQVIHQRPDGSPLVLLGYIIYAVLY